MMKLKVEHNKKKVELTVEQTQGLYVELDKLFGCHGNYTPAVPYPVPYPYPYPYYQEPWGITWSDTTHLWGGSGFVNYVLGL